MGPNSTMHETSTVQSSKTSADYGAFLSHRSGKRKEHPVKDRKNVCTRIAPERLLLSVFIYICRRLPIFKQQPIEAVSYIPWDKTVTCPDMNETTPPITIGFN